MLKLAENLKLPDAILAQHVVMLGKTGSGKSSALRFVVEDLLSRNKRVCIIDPKGDWWGIKVAADGRGPGLPVILFGDFKKESARDVPINDRSGKHIAELVSDGNRPCVIGLRGWTQGAMTRLWIDFASTLFAKNAGELFLVGDEFHNFAPKQWKGMSDRETPVGVGLHWANRILSEGRGLGLVCLIASQRPQKVHNDTLTSCETLVAMRVVHAADRAAVKAWIDGNGDDKLGKEVLDSLAGMQRGEAWIWSPEIEFGPKRCRFPLFGTFDSFAPPQLQKRVSDKGWADVDLGEVKAALAEAVKEAEANDPKLLRQQIAELRKQLAGKPTAPPDQFVFDRAIEAAVAKRDREWQASIKEHAAIIDSLKGRMGKAVALLNVNGEAVPKSAVPAVVRTPAVQAAPKPRPVRQSSVQVGDVEIGKCERAILQVLAQFPEGCEIGKLALLSGYRVSGGFRNSLSTLRTAGLMEGENTGTMTITSAGEAAGPFDALPAGTALANYWLTHRNFGKCERAILAALLEQPSGMTIDDLAATTNYEVSGGFRNSLSTLRTAGVLVGRNTETMKASDELF